MSGQATLTRSVVQTVPGEAEQGQRACVAPWWSNAPLNDTPVGLFTSL